ncbi:SecDF P1 head subdomain-containing protein [Marinobacter lipolyticus]|uniref:SecDF P1 head subdomain-containing protein n=1 Tax=Marinobacter lipolyticus TaxID=209639 RepID=UPI003A945429
MRWLTFLLLAASVYATAGTEPEFHLCSPYVEKAMVGEQSSTGSWPVVVKLSNRGTASFEAFSEANIGRMVHIVAGDRQFARATVSAVVTTGHLRGEYSSEQDASAWQKILTEELLKAPCGVK